MVYRRVAEAMRLDGFAPADAGKMAIALRSKAEAWRGEAACAARSIAATLEGGGKVSRPDLSRKLDELEADCADFATYTFLSEAMNTIASNMCGLERPREGGE